MKVLYISDSLGTPIHPRGIFNYSIAFVEILKSLGGRVDLVVEGAPGFGMEERIGALRPDSMPAIASMQLSELHRYFNEGKFSFRWNFRTVKYRALVKLFKPLLWLWLRARSRPGPSSNVKVQNDETLIEFTPSKSSHLNLFDGFIIKRNFYSSSMSRANLGFSPPMVSADGYDLAIVDTPHFIKVEGISPSRIMTVVHDLIPLRDPTMDQNWRYLFVRKLNATLKLSGHMIFVSEYTRSTFHRAFPNYKTRSENVFYPAIRRSWLKNAEEGADTRMYSTGISRPSSHVLSDAGDQKPGRKKKNKGAKLADWDASLPYFVTAVSDEPRKNVGLLLRGFEQLGGRANIVVVGEISPKRYSKLGAERLENVHFTGYVSEQEKFRLFSLASGVVFPSFAEGFGIPLVEGAAMGLPVLCSDIAVFREVAGSNAFYFDPYQPASLVSAVDTVLNDPGASRYKAENLRAAVLARFRQDAIEQQVKVALDGIGVLGRL